MTDRRTDVATFWVLIGLALLAAALVVGVLPIATCSACGGSGEDFMVATGSGIPPPCGECAGKGRISPLRKWTSP